MKISKLFHWLYAVLMFLPLVMFLPSCLYYAFNDNAQSQVKTKEEPVYYETNEVSDYNDLLIGNIYHWGDNQGSIEGLTTNYFLFTIKPTENLYFITNLQNTTEIVLYVNSNGLSMRVTYNDSTQTFPSVRSITFDFVIDTVQSNISYANYVIDHISSSEMLLVKEYLEVTYTLSITDSINYAWDRTWNLPVFSWTQNSFVTAPFSYITGLFGLSSDNSINYVFTYFVSISICWLVFDLIMYVPNLAHRWLDKGAIE